MNKTRRCLLLIVVIFLICVLSVGVYFARLPDCIHLGMEDNSAAYMFKQSEASDQLAIGYLRKEQENSNIFNCTWESAIKQRRTNARLRNISVPKGLKEEHLLAVIAYTMTRDKECGDLSNVFNHAVRTYGGSDGDYQKFPFKSFHYFLSVALERLRGITGSAPPYIYRGMSKPSCSTVGKEMRFGYFASFSRSNAVAYEFGRGTMFTINSKYGVRIEEYSFNETQQEVLIPPYELFNITAYSKRGDEVNVSLSAVGVQWIPVTVERDERGDMRVVRDGGAPISAMAGLCVLALLGPISV